VQVQAANVNACCAGVLTYRQKLRVCKPSAAFVQTLHSFKAICNQFQYDTSSQFGKNVSGARVHNDCPASLNVSNVETPGDNF
jgi:hypothetical protein